MPVELIGIHKNFLLQRERARERESERERERQRERKSKRAREMFTLVAI